MVWPLKMDTLIVMTAVIPVRYLFSIFHVEPAEDAGKPITMSHAEGITCHADTLVVVPVRIIAPVRKSVQVPLQRERKVRIRAEPITTTVGKEITMIDVQNK